MSVSLHFSKTIVINLYTGYYKKGTLIMKRRHIMCRYLRTWFAVDFIASFPYTWVIDFDYSYYDEDGNVNRSDIVAHHTSQLLRLLKILRFIRIIRLIRLFKLRKLVNKVRIPGLKVYSLKKYSLTILSRHLCRSLKLSW